MTKQTTPTNTKSITLQKPTGETFSFNMIEVQGGSFKMGSDAGHYDDELPIHEVNVPTFWLAQFPVTQALYAFVTGENPSYFKGKKRPVEQVSWDDSKAFIQKLNVLCGRNFRLPSEAEWEYAARGGIHWKDDFQYSGSNELKKVAWYKYNSHEETKAVGLKLPNQLGLYDMSGNVYEWCEDDRHNSYEGAPDDGSAWIDEPRKNDGPRLLRGGSWYFNYDDYCHVAYRFYDNANARNYDIGLRLALSQF